MTNIFDNPRFFRNMILDKMQPTEPNIDISGKGLACVFLTRYCPVACDFCFFKSLPQNGKKTTYDAFNQVGMDNLVKFINDANLSYLLISGGGDPCTEFDNILRLVKETKVDKIVIVTSGFWAKGLSKANEYLTKLSDATKDKQVTLRLSYDEHHVSKLHSDIGLNLLYLFQTKFKDNPNLAFRMHTMIGDKAIEGFLQSIASQVSDKTLETLSSDSKIVKKINPYDDIITMNDGFEFTIGYANRFYPDARLDMRDSAIIDRNLRVFNEDMRNSEGYNSSVVENVDGKRGLDFWINYNGNVCTWGNQVPGNIHNVYMDSYADVVRETFRDPLSLSYIEKGAHYRNDIIREVSPKTVLKSKLINIRDYVGAILFEEEKIQLYYTLRVLQDMNYEGRLSPKQLVALPKAVTSLLGCTKEHLQALYKESEYDITDQVLSKPLTKAKCLDVLELINLGHYDVSDEKAKAFLGTVNKLYGLNIESIDKTPARILSPYDRRIIPMKEMERE